MAKSTYTKRKGIVVALMSLACLGMASLFGYMSIKFPDAAPLFITFAIFMGWGAGIHHVYAIPPHMREM